MKSNNVLVVKYDYGDRVSYNIGISCGAGLWAASINKDKAEHIINKLKKMSVVKHSVERIYKDCYTECWSCSKIKF